MRLTRLKLENWMKIPQLTLEFAPGVNLVSGPNEIGKSSIMKAIDYALFGDAGSNKTGYHDLIPWGTAVKARVELDFTTKEDRHYRVKKSFPRGEAELFLDNLKIADDPRKTQEKLFDILGITKETAGLLGLLFIGQGQALDLFDKDFKELDKDSLGEAARGHLKNIIRQTALKSLQQLELYLAVERDTLFTNPDMKRLKTGQNAPRLSQLLDKWQEAKERLAPLQEKIDQLTHSLQEMETLERDIQALDRDRADKEAGLKALQTKKEKLDELEKKQLAFLPLKKEYDDFLGLETDISAMQRQLPGLYARAQELLKSIEAEIKERQTGLETSRLHLGDLKKKQQASVELAGRQRVFEEIQKAYRESRDLQGKLQESDRVLPGLLRDLHRELATKRQELQTRLDNREKCEVDLKEVTAQLETRPAISGPQVEEARGKRDFIQDLESKLQAARSALRLSFGLTPLTGKPVRFQLKVDQGDWQSIEANAPVQQENFQDLAFIYPNHFRIDVSGRPAEIDVGALQTKLQEMRAALASLLSPFSAATVQDLEKQFQAYSELKNQQQDLQRQLGQQEPAETLKNQVKTIDSELLGLDREIATLHSPLPDLSAPAPYPAGQTEQQIREALTRVRTQKESLADRLTAILHDRTPEALENDFQAKETEYKQATENLDLLPPPGIAQVTGEHLDQAAREIIDLEKMIAKREQERELLLAFTGKGDAHPVLAKPFASLSAQDIRDTLLNTEQRLKDRQTKRQDLLAGREPMALTREYQLKNSELEMIRQQVKALEPAEIDTLAAIESKIETIKQELDRNGADIKIKQSRRDVLSGEIKGFDGLSQEKDQVQFDREKLLPEIKQQQIDIYALKLLLYLAAAEKEQAQQQVFKPLEERVARGFNRLAPGKYELALSSDLGIGISSRTPDGSPIETVNPFLSFGTKEQLSFLLRLAIAQELSVKEPQVMILDDSFVNTDPLRLREILAMIADSAGAIQFLLFTCKPDDYRPFPDYLKPIDLERLLSLPG